MIIFQARMTANTKPKKSLLKFRLNHWQDFDDHFEDDIFEYQREIIDQKIAMS